MLFIIIQKESYIYKNACLNMANFSKKMGQFHIFKKKTPQAEILQKDLKAKANHQKKKELHHSDVKKKKLEPISFLCKKK